MPGQGQIPYYVFMPKAITAGWTQVEFYAWAREKEGIWTARDSTMREKWHNLAEGQGYIGAIERLSENTLVPKSYMVDPIYPGRRHQYTYTVGYDAKAEEEGGFLSQHVTVVSDSLLTKGEIIGAAESWAEDDPYLYGIEAQDIGILRAEWLQ